MFVAHRGNDNHNYRENSEKAILFSLNKPYISGVECDIRITKDKKIVLYHNMLIDFGSDGSGFVHNQTLNELLKYNFSNEKITILEDILSKIDTNKIILLEIKEERINIVEDWINALTPILSTYSNLNIYLCSFNYELIKKLKEHFKTKAGLIIGYKMNQNKDIKPFDFVMYQYKSFKYTNKITMIWTVNTKEKAKEYQKRVDYIITDKAYEFI